MVNCRTVVKRNKTKRINQKGGTLLEDLKKLVPSGIIREIRSIIAFHPTEPLFAAASRNNVNLWQLSADNSSATCVATLEGHTDEAQYRIKSVAFCPTAPLLATGSTDNTVKLWRIYSPDEPNESRSTKIATLISDKLIRLNKKIINWLSGIGTWRGSCVATLLGHSGCVESVAFHPTMPLLATGSEDKTAKLWQLSDDNSSAKCVATLNVPPQTDPQPEREGDFYRSVTSVAFHPTEPLLASGHKDKTARLWRYSLGDSSIKLVATLKGHDDLVTSVAFCPTAPLLASGSHDRTAKLWRLSSDNSSAECVATLTEHTDWVNSVAFHPAAPLLATGGNDSLELWNISDPTSMAMKPVTTQKRVMESGVNNVSFHPTLPLMATGVGFYHQWPAVEIWDFTEIMKEWKEVDKRIKREMLPKLGMRNELICRLFGLPSKPRSGRASGNSKQLMASGNAPLDFNKARLDVLLKFALKSDLIFSSLTFKQLNELKTLLTKKPKILYSGNDSEPEEVEEAGGGVAVAEEEEEEEEEEEN